MTAFTPRVSGDGDSETPASRPARHPAPGPWEDDAAGRGADLVWPQPPHDDSHRGRRRAVSAVRQVPVDAEVVDLAERERERPVAVAPVAPVAPVADHGGRVIDIRDDMQRRARLDAEPGTAAGTEFDSLRSGVQHSDDIRSPERPEPLPDDHRPDGADPAEQGRPPHHALHGSPPPPSAAPGRRRQSVTSQQQPQPPYAPVPAYEAFDADPDATPVGPPRGGHAHGATALDQVRAAAPLRVDAESPFAPFGPVPQQGGSSFAPAPVATDEPQVSEDVESPVTASVLPPRVVDPLAEPLFDAAGPHGVPLHHTAPGETDDTDDAPRIRPGARHRAVTAPSSVNRRVRHVSLGAAGLSLFVVVVLWAAAGGLTDLLSPALAIGSLSRLAGLLGTDLLLIQVLLMARIPAVERAFGRAVLTRWHTLTGMISFGLIVAHIALSVSGTAILEQFNIFEAGWRLLSTTAGLPLAVVATALLVLVAVTSRREARHRRRDTRHLLTLYAYAGLLLALPHQLAAGTSLTDSPLGSVYWWGLFLGVSAALLVFRLGVPLFRSFRHQLVVDEVIIAAPGVVTVSLRGRQLRRLGARAGEFFHWRFLDGAGWHRALVSPLSAVPTGDRLRITLTGTEGSDRLESLSPGTWVLFEGPYGSLTVDGRTRAKLAFFASGLGIAPVRALLEDLDYGRDDAVVVYRLPDDSPALFVDELDALSKRRGAEVVYLEGPTAQDRESWLPTTAAAQIGDDAAVTHLVPDISDRDVYVSGPEAWTVALLGALREAGVPHSQVHSEVVAV